MRSPSVIIDFSPDKSDYDKVHLTLTWLTKVVKKSTRKTCEELLKVLKAQNINCISKLCWRDHMTRNVLLRVNKIIREECEVKIKSGAQEVTLLSEEDLDHGHLSVLIASDIKESILDGLNELMIEVETSKENIALQALNHIHANECILAFGYSESVAMFLSEAGKTRNFTLFVCEAFPHFGGRKLVKSLAKSSPSISIILIPDANIFAVMSRVNKVVIGCNIVLSNGAVQSLSGTYALALSAKHYNIPFIVCSPFYKFCKDFCPSLPSFASPDCNHLDYAHSQSVDSYYTSFDVLPPEFIAFFVSNTGTFSPTYVYQLMRELYHNVDLNENLDVS